MSMDTQTVPRARAAQLSEALGKGVEQIKNQWVKTQTVARRSLAVAKYSLLNPYIITNATCVTLTLIHVISTMVSNDGKWVIVAVLATWLAAMLIWPQQGGGALRQERNRL